MPPHRRINWFESWFVKQFGADKQHLLTRDVDGGYESVEVNALWVGFNAGVEYGAVYQ